MKVDLIKKYKWYILGLIIAWILMAVGLSFCAWDDNSIRKISIAGGTANFATKPDIKYVIVSDVNGDNVADVGDIVTYGSYYQTAEAATKDSIRWIVVHKANNELTLLAESVLTFGNFWNRHYYNTSGSGAWENTSFQQYYQNYMVSTLSMWLNSDYGARHDQGVAFTPDSSKLGMRGFMNEAFSTDQIKNINNRTISGIRGHAQQNDISFEDYGSKTYKVWVPSWSEIYGTRATPWGTTIDGSPNTQFQYFKDQGVAFDKDNPSLVGKTTAFASTPGKSNYTLSADTSHIENAQSKSAGGSVWWWLRSPCPTPHYATAMIVRFSGSGGDAPTSYSFGGVRPAICIPA